MIKNIKSSIKQVCAVSDLHKYSSRSTFHWHREEIYKAMAASDIFVFNGDIFDFRWTNLNSVEETIIQATQWLGSLAKQSPHCQLHFIPGNHDCHPAFLNSLSELTRQHSNFHWHEYYFKFGDTVFLHGDIIDSGPGNDKLKSYRQKFIKSKKHGTLSNFIYDLVVGAGLHIVLSRLRPRHTQANRLLSYLKPEVIKGVRRICYGHTHCAFENYLYNNISFCNSGTMTRGLSHKIMQMTINNQEFNYE